MGVGGDRFPEVDALIERMGDTPFLVPDVTPKDGRHSRTRVFHYLRDLCDGGKLKHTDKGYVRAGGAHIADWVCDKCGQALTGALDECNSGIHVGPDGKNKGHAVAGGGHTADAKAVRKVLPVLANCTCGHHQSKHHFPYSLTNPGTGWCGERGCYCQSYTSTGEVHPSVSALARLEAAVTDAEKRELAWAERAEVAESEVDIQKSVAHGYKVGVKVTEAERDAALTALRLAYPYVKDALEQGGMTNEIEAIIRADLDVIGPTLAASRAVLGGPE